MNTARILNNTSMEYVMENTKDHNEFIEYFKTIDMPTLEHINTCSGIAIQELNSTVEDMKLFFEEFDSIYSIYDEDLAVERVEELESTTDLTDRKEAMYLKRWLIKERKFGKYV